MDKAQIKTLAILSIVTLGFGLLASHAGAKSPCRPGGKADQHLQKIKKNQPILAKARADYQKVVTSVSDKKKIDGDVAAYNKYVEAREWNRLEGDAIWSEGCQVDWSTMKLIEISNSKPSVIVPTPKKVSDQPETKKSPSTAFKIDLSQFGEKDRLTKEQLVAILRDAGFSGKALEVAYAVARAESGHRPKAYNGNAKSGDKSYGIFQINMLGNLGPARRKQHGISSNEELFQPEINARIAYKMSNGGTNWKPWSAYKSGAYKKYLTSL